MSEDGKVFLGQGAKLSKEQGMGEILPPKGLPDNIRQVIITFDVTTSRLQIAGPILDKVLVFGMLITAMFEVFKFNEKNELEKKS